MGFGVNFSAPKIFRLSVEVYWRNGEGLQSDKGR
jgi:hypothetical protein